MLQGGTPVYHQKFLVWFFFPLVITIVISCWADNAVYCIAVLCVTLRVGWREWRQKNVKSAWCFPHWKKSLISCLGLRPFSLILLNCSIDVNGNPKCRMKTECSLLSFWSITKYKPGIYKIFVIEIIAKHIIFGKLSQTWMYKASKLVNIIQCKIIYSCVFKVLKTLAVFLSFANSSQELSHERYMLFLLMCTYE